MDLAWCLGNTKTLSLESFATKFGYQDKNKANNRYKDILTSIAFKNNASVDYLFNAFENWKGSTFEKSFWEQVALNQKKRQIGAILQEDGYETASHFSLQAASELRTRSSNDLPSKANKHVKTSHESQEEVFSAESSKHLDDLAVSSSQQHESQPDSFTDTSSDSYIHEDVISDDSQRVDARDVFDYLTTTEGVYDVSVPSITKFWKVASGFNISESFLQYRETCIEKAKAHQNLEAHEELALSGILLIDDNICEEYYFPFEYVEEVLQDVEAVDYFHIPNADEEESRLCQTFAYHMQQRRVNYDHVDRILNDMQHQEKFKQLKYMLSSFARIYCMNYSIHPINEATLVHDTINMMIDAYFRNSPIIKCLGADNMSSSSSTRFTNMDPSLVNHGKRPDFNVVSNREKHLLLALEAKRCGRSVSGDFVKLAKLLKDSLNQISTSGYKDVAVVGFLLKGSVCSVYVMDHVYDYIYRMVLVSKVNMPRDRYDMSSLLPAICAMKKLSSIVDRAARIVNRPVPNNKDLPRNTMSFHTPIRITDKSSKPKLNRSHPRVQRACLKLDFSNM